MLDREARWSGCTVLKPRWPEPTNPVSEVPGTVQSLNCSFGLILKRVIEVLFEISVGGATGSPQPTVLARTCEMRSVANPSVSPEKGQV